MQTLNELKALLDSNGCIEGRDYVTVNLFGHEDNARISFIDTDDLETVYLSPKEAKTFEILNPDEEENPEEEMLSFMADYKDASRPFERRDYEFCDLSIIY